MKISVLLILTTASTTWAATPGPLPPKADQDLARDILKELVDINTTHDHGSTAAAQVMQQQLLAAGFPVGDVVLIAPADKPTKGNLVVRYRAKKQGVEPVLFLGHLDVVEAKREDWTHRSFSADGAGRLVLRPRHRRYERRRRRDAGDTDPPQT